MTHGVPAGGGGGAGEWRDGRVRYIAGLQQGKQQTGVGRAVIRAAGGVEGKSLEVMTVMIMMMVCYVLITVGSNEWDGGRGGVWARRGDVISTRRRGGRGRVRITVRT